MAKKVKNTPEKKTIWIDKRAHKLLTDKCKRAGYKMSDYVSFLIKEDCGEKQ